MDTFDFCPNTRVIEEVAPDEAAPISMNGWDFTIKPSEPYRRKFMVNLHGLRWYVGASGLDLNKDADNNAGRLLDFYREHRLYKPFLLHHEYLGAIECRFASAVDIKAAIPDSSGLIEAFDISMVHHNPRY